MPRVTRCGHCRQRPARPSGSAPEASRATYDHPSAIRALNELDRSIINLEYGVRGLLEATGPKSYAMVKAVFLNWESCDLDPTVHNETVNLQTLLRDEYLLDAGVENDIYQIPSSEPTLELDQYVTSVLLEYSKLDTSGHHKLMIFYYNGHGGVDSSNNLIISG